MRRSEENKLIGRYGIFTNMRCRWMLMFCVCGLLPLTSANIIGTSADLFQWHGTTELWQHGWPLRLCLRHGPYSSSWEIYYGWISLRTGYYFWTAYIVDGFVWVALLIGCARACSHSRLVCCGKCQVRLRTIVVAITWLCVLLAFRDAEYCRLVVLPLLAAATCGYLNTIVP